MKEFRAYKSKKDALIINKLKRTTGFLKSLKIKALILASVIAFLFSGCFSAKAAKVVYVPTHCDVPKREKPKQDSNALRYLKEVLIYAEGLESDLAFCRGELIH